MPKKKKKKEIVKKVHNETDNDTKNRDRMNKFERKKQFASEIMGIETKTEAKTV